MLHNMAVAFNAVLPSFLIIAVGMLIRRRGLVGETALNQFNSVAFRVFLAAQLFKNVYDSSVAESFDLRLTVFIVTAAKSLDKNIKDDIAKFTHLENKVGLSKKSEDVDDFLHGNLGESLLNFLVGGGTGNEPVDSLGVVDILEVAELRAKHLLGEELAEDARGLGTNIGQSEMVTK